MKYPSLRLFESPLCQPAPLRRLGAQHNGQGLFPRKFLYLSVEEVIGCCPENCILCHRFSVLEFNNEHCRVYRPAVAHPVLPSKLYLPAARAVCPLWATRSKCSTPSKHSPGPQPGSAAFLSRGAGGTVRALFRQPCLGDLWHEQFCWSEAAANNTRRPANCGRQMGSAPSTPARGTGASEAVSICA